MKEIVPFPIPLLGVKESQVAPPLTLQFSVPPPVLLTLTVLAAGFDPPCWAVKDKLVGLTPMAGGTGAAVTAKETGIITVVAPGAVNEMEPV